MDIRFIKGVGPKRQELLAQVGITTGSELLAHYPRRYEDRTTIYKIRDLADGQIATVLVTVANSYVERPGQRVSILKAIVKDDSGGAIATWFNQAYLKVKLSSGKEILLTGKVKRRPGQVEILAQDLLFLESEKGKEEEENLGQLLPIYPSTQGLNQKFFRQTIAWLLDNGKELTEYYNQDFLLEHNLLGLNDAVKKIHQPKSWQDIRDARRRLVFDEFFLFQLSVLLISKKGFKIGFMQNTTGKLTEPWLADLPFALTDSQNQVIAEINRDMAKPKAMARLVQGDVGSGKTVVAAWALLASVENGYQGAMMAPTELLASQHFETISTWFEPLGIKLGLFKGGQSQKEKSKMLDALANGEINIAIGTHALFQESVVFKNLGLIIIDEQHRFGVKQRVLLQEKGVNPDLLVMSATPIPRTLALTIYGDLDVSSIKGLPPGRIPVKTICILEKAREKLNQLLLRELEQGHQGFVVCPLIQESEVMDLKNAEEVYFQLAKRLAPYQVGLLHGRLKSEEKESIMAAFVAGKINILVSTTVIEVGVNIPKATVMVIENSERFGLAQLHQLRGRVGRSDLQAYCVLVTNTKEPLALQRLKLMTDTQDGFLLAKKDMELRGPGEFFGTKQHGLPEFNLANLPEDESLLEEAREAALKLLALDPGLSLPVHEGLKKIVVKKIAKMANS